MGAQIIKRKAGKMPEITTVGEGRSQISYNSNGHIIIRYIASQNNDTLIVLDSRTSDILINFIHNTLKCDDKPHFDNFRWAGHPPACLPDY